MHIKNLFVRSTLFFLPFFCTFTILLVSVYTMIQQDIRQGSNDPQIQVAEYVSDAVAKGESIASISSQYPTIDISRNLGTYIMVFDSHRNLLLSTATIQGKPPRFPLSVFSFVDRFGEDRITWQTKEGIRSAVVVAKIGLTNGYVVSGRSLREVENREDLLTIQLAASWIAIMASSYASIFLALALKQYTERKHC